MEISIFFPYLILGDLGSGWLANSIEMVRILSLKLDPHVENKVAFGDLGRALRA